MEISNESIEIFRLVFFDVTSYVKTCCALFYVFREEFSKGKGIVSLELSILERGKKKELF